MLQPRQFKILELTSEDLFRVSDNHEKHENAGLQPRKHALKVFIRTVEVISRARVLN